MDTIQVDSTIFGPRAIGTMNWFKFQVGLVWMAYQVEAFADRSNILHEKVCSDHNEAEVFLLQWKEQFWN